jgi:hypothetical protein
MGVAFSGEKGTVTAGAVDMDVTGWSADMEVNTIDTSTTAELGWEDAIYGLRKFSGSFEFFYNPAKRPTGASAGLLPGSTTYPTLTLLATTGETFTGSAMITKLSFKSKVKDAFAVTATFTSKGAWTLPT